MFQNLIVRTALKKLTDGDTGSSILGVVASGLLAAKINFGDLFSKDKGKQATAIGLLAGTAITLVWGYYTGKGKIA